MIERNRSIEDKPRQETLDVAASEGQTPMWGNPLIDSSIIFNSYAEREIVQMYSSVILWQQ